MRVSIIMPTFNRCFMLPQALTSILSQTHKEWELIVIDDGSTDETEKVIQPYITENIHYIRTLHMGTPRAWNLGVKKSGHEYLFLTGDDVTLDPSCLTMLARAAKLVKDERLGAIAPRLIYTSDVTNPEDESEDESENESEDKKYAYIDPYTGDVAGSFNLEISKTLEVPIIHGYSLVRKEAFLDVGGFDERTYSGNYYREETDVWQRFRMKGYKLYYEPKAKIYCQKSLTKGGQWSNVNGKLLAYEYYVLRNHTKFLSKFYGRQRFLMFPTFIIRRLYTRLTEEYDDKK
jgi:glycosyltransferase involved in cell wall biosynthesis